ncbi:hypothetical protein VTP01DRAFT_10597 [Rhizomucor pusillus]|uniref:uncharacterized protein n=1 Tax=Rhizomucor pusillus TaxID=4840 RepID=UPI003743A319
MSVSLTPATQITFSRDGQGAARTTAEVLCVKNPGREPVVFKVKTTAPQYYCVKPNAGRVEPNSETQIQVFLQPTKKDILDERLQSKDKFLIQTAYLKPEYKNMSYIDMWRRIEQEDKESIHRHKIKCALLPIASEPKDQQQQQQQQQQQEVQQEIKETKPVLETPPDSPSATSTSSLSTADDEQQEETLAEQCQRLTQELHEAQQKIQELTRGLAAAAASREEGAETPTAAAAAEAIVAPAPTHTTSVHQENHPVSVAWTAAAVTFWLAYMYFF